MYQHSTYNICTNNIIYKRTKHTPDRRTGPQLSGRMGCAKKRKKNLYTFESRVITPSLAADDHPSRTLNRRIRTRLPIYLV